MKNQNEWMKRAVFYQVYPTSFYDSNGDGVGDFKGITEKLGYIKSLGVDALWINPFFKSPFKDGGYDVEDFYKIDERFGTDEEFDEFLRECKKSGLKVIIDLVIGHTSDKHEWFIRSAEKERNEYSDYYIWTDSIFNGYKGKTLHGFYDRNGGYYINYYGCQPALNYGFSAKGKTKTNELDDYDLGDGWKMHYTDERLKPLREEIIKIIDFWMDRGVDGFRVDMANSLVKGYVYDAQDTKDIEGLIWVWNQIIPRTRKKYPHVFFLAEWCCPENAVGKCGFDLDYYGHDMPCYNDLFRNEKGTNLMPSFERGSNYFSLKGKGTVKRFIDHTLSLYEKLGGEGSFSAPTGCHDSIRMATGAGASADEIKLIYAFLLTYKQVPMVYYGDEIGMTHDFSVSKDGGFIRTGSRTPMQWDDGKNRGFSVADEVYLPTNDVAEQCVASQEKDENSLLNTFRKIIKIRKENSCLSSDAALDIVECDDGYPLIYSRSDENGKITVYLNPSNKKIVRKTEDGEVLLSHNCEKKGDTVTLGAASFAIIKNR